MHAFIMGKIKESTIGPACISVSSLYEEVYSLSLKYWVSWMVNKSDMNSFIVEKNHSVLYVIC